jgi:hypothetical protein
MNAIEQLKSVLCDPESKCCITGSDEDRAIVDRALQALAAQPAPVPEGCVVVARAVLNKLGIDDAVVDTIARQAPPAQTAPVPLTQQQVVDGFCKTPHQTQYVAIFDAGVRFAEAAHGIPKGQP